MQIFHIDDDGWLKLPAEVLEAFGSGLGQVVTAEITAGGLLIRPRVARTPITDRIAAMDLPIGDWEDMERDIGAGRLG